MNTFLTAIAGGQAMKLNRLMLAGLAGVLLATSAQAQEWTRFRGPNGTGVSTAKTIPVQFTEKDYNWKVPLPGDGHSSPVIWGDKIFLTGSHEQQGGLMVHAVSVNDGRVLWQKDFPFPAFAKHKFNSYASCTPAVDAERVYVTWSTPEHNMLVAFSHKGDVVWQRDFGAYKSQHGSGVSPMVYEEMVILPNDQDENSSLIAVDRRTGKTVWETKRNNSAAAYGTPCVYEPKGGKPQLIFNSQAHGITGVDPATGKTVWEYAKAFNKRSVSSPVIVSGLAIGSCGSGGGGNYVVAVKPGDDAKNQPATLVWEMKKSAHYVPTPVVVGDLLFGWSDAGIVTCMKGPTGEVLWQERAGGNFFGSPIVVDGKIYAIATNGEVVVVKAADKFEVLGRSALGELTHTTPAVAGGKMYIRTLKHLISLGGSKMAPLKATQ
ncbi:MAG: Pyrrolo-quinoline quinone [Verrucomicrobia bacterium]|jgi:outer membrane protein assembly factor BamB|nr:Pyrrolo-quinoline quinone [Verrucomicrobiota bacterium]